jgi:hypothetical protein
MRRSVASPAAPLPARTAPSDPSAAIDAFWRWWQTAKGPIAEAVAKRTLDAWTDPISEHVSAIHAGLEWELGPGVKSEHHLCVSAAGNAALRVTAERWLSRAPAPDELWEYYSARQPSRADAKLRLTMDGVDLDYADFRVKLEVDDHRRIVHVTVFHPKLPELPERARGTATFLFLDNLLGEDDVERWIGRVETGGAPPADAVPREALRQAARDLAAKNPAFTVLRGERDGRAFIVSVNFGVKRVDHLLMDSHVEVTIAYRTEREDGFYSESVGEDVNDMEEALLEALGNDAVFIGHETGDGRRVVHLHVAAGGPASSRISEWERMHPTWDIEVTAKNDPAWEILRRW